MSDLLYILSKPIQTFYGNWIPFAILLAFLAIGVSYGLGTHTLYSTSFGVKKENEVMVAISATVCFFTAIGLGITIFFR